MSPDGRLAASGGADRIIRLWDTGDQNRSGAARVLTGHTAAVRCVAFSPDGRLLISSGFDQQVLVWDVVGGRVLCAFPAHDTITISIAFHSGGELLATGDQNHMVRLWRLTPPALRPGLLPTEEISHAMELSAELRGHTSIVVVVRFSPDGCRLYSGSLGETIREWDVATHACLRVLRAEGPYAGMGITGTTGLSDGQRASLRALGAVERA